MIECHVAKSGQTEHFIPEQTEHMIPEMVEHLKPESKHHNINAKRKYVLIINRLLTLNRNEVLINTGICSKIQTIGQIKESNEDTTRRGRFLCHC
jgi:hypothetical protein